MKKILVLSAFCSLLLAFIGTAAADNVHKCGDCIENAASNDTLTPNVPYLDITKENLTTTVIEVGGQIKWKLNFSNYGNWYAYNVKINDELPVGLQYTDMSQIVYGNTNILAVGGQYHFEVGNDGRSLQWTFDVLASGASGYIIFNTTATGTTACADNNATINGTYNELFCRNTQGGEQDCEWYWIGLMSELDAGNLTNDGRLDNQTTSYNETIPNSCITVTPTTTISVTKYASGSGDGATTPSYEVCENMNYTITVTQTGGVTLPVNINDTFGNTCVFQNNSGVFENGADNKSKIYTYFYQLVSGQSPKNNITAILGYFNGTGAYDCTNTVNVNGTVQVSPFLPVTATTTETVHIKYPNLDITKDMSGTCGTSQNLTYTITVKNTAGDGIAKNITINDSLPYDTVAGGLIINASPIGGTCNDTSGMRWTTQNTHPGAGTTTLNVFDNITLNGGESCTIIYYVNIPSNYNTGLGCVNTACIKNATDNCTRTINAAYGLGECDSSIEMAAPMNYEFNISKTANNTRTSQSGEAIPAQAGDLINYTITVKNTGGLPIIDLDFADLMFTGNNGFEREGDNALGPNPDSGLQCTRSVTSDKRLVVGDPISCWYTVRVTCDAIEGAHLNQLTVDAEFSDTAHKQKMDFAVVYVSKPKLIIEKWTNVDTIAPDGTVRVFVRITNIGSGNATNLLITDTGFHGYTIAPELFAYTSATAEQGSNCHDLSTIAGGAGGDYAPNVTLSTLAGSNDGNGESCTYYYDATADHNIKEPAVYTNIVTIRYNDTNDTSHCPLLNQSATAHVSVTSDITLSVIKEAISIVGIDGTTDPRNGGKDSHAEPSDCVLYMINTTNTGNNHIHNVTLVDQIPDGWEYNINACNNACGSYDTGWNGGPNGSVTITVNVTGDLHGKNTTYLCLHVTSDASCGPTENKVVATGNAPDQRPLDDSDKARPIEVIKPHLIIEKWADATRDQPGETVNYSIRVKNVGCNDINKDVIGTKGTAERITVTDYLSQWLNHTRAYTGTCVTGTNELGNVNTDYTNVAGDGSAYVLGGGIADFNLTKLEPGQECIFTYSANISINAPEGLYSNLARVNYTDNNASNYLNQTASAYILVNFQVDHLLLNKEISKRYLQDGTIADKGGPFLRGDTVEFDIYINNTGSRNMTVNITDFLDTKTTGLDFTGITTGTYNLNDQGIAIPLHCSGNYTNGVVGNTNLPVSVSNDYTLNTSTTTKVVISGMNILPYGNVWCRINATVKSTIIDGIHCNKVEVVTKTEDGRALLKEDSACLLTGRPYIEFLKEPLTDLTHPERTAEFRVNVKNTGTAMVAIANFIDYLPDGFFYKIGTLTSFNPDNEYCGSDELGGPVEGPVDFGATAATNPVIFQLTNIPAYCEGSFRFTVGIPVDTPPGSYANVMWANYTPGYPAVNYTNYTIGINATNYTYWYNISNQTSKVVSITTDVSMLVDKYVNTSNAQPGDDVYYWIVVNNTGNNTLHQVDINDTLPLGLDIHRINGSSLSCTAALNCSNDDTQAVEGAVYVINQTQWGISNITGNATLVNYTLNCSFDLVTPGQDTVHCTGDLTPGYVVIGITVHVNTTDSSISDAYEPFEGENCNKVVVTSVLNTARYKETDQACLQIRKPHLAIEKWAEGNPTKVQRRNVTYFIRVRNTGTADATNITVNDSMAFGAETSWVLGNVISCSELTVGKNASYFNLSGTLNAGEECTFSYNLTVPNNATGIYENLATVRGIDMDNTTLQEKMAKAYVMIIRSGPIIDKEINAKVVEPNDTVTITLKVTNLGDAALTNIQVVDNLPVGWEFTNNTHVVYDGALKQNSPACNGGGTTMDIGIIVSNETYINTTAQRVNFSIDTLCENSRATITFTAKIHDASKDGVNQNNATMNATDYYGNNTYYANTSTTIIVNNPVNDSSKRIRIVKSADKYAVEPGDNITFTLYIMNPSAATLYDINISDVMRQGFDYLTGTTKWNGNDLPCEPMESVDDGDSANQALFWSMSNTTCGVTKLVPYSVNILTYTATVGCNLTIDNWNYANVSAYTATGETMMNDSTNISIKSGHSNISLTKYASNYKPSFFDYVDYTIVIRHNTSWAHVQGLNLTDTIPTGLRYMNGSLRIGDIKIYTSGTNLYDCPSYTAYNNSLDGCIIVGNLSGSDATTTTILLNLSGYVFLDAWDQIKIEYTVQVRPNVRTNPQNNVTMYYLDPAVPGGAVPLSAYSAILVPPSFGQIAGASAAEVTSISLGDEEVDSINLNAGWNLVAISVMPANKNIDVVLSSIDGKYVSVFAYENDWTFKAKAYGQWFGSLAVIEPGKGYWIDATEKTTLLVYGKKVTSMDINLKGGWNLVGYSVQDSKALIDILPIYSDIYGYTNGDWTYKTYAYGSWFGDLNSLNKDKGYWVNSKQATTLVFGE